MKKVSSALITMGILGIFLGTSIFILTFYPVLNVELKYQAGKIIPTEKIISPIDTKFGIVIPKIEANAKLVANVDPFNQKIYQYALTKGVAHALGSSFPGQPGHVFLFSHSSVNFYEAQRYNSIFYLLDKLEKGDDIYLYYNDEKFRYKVSEKKLVFWDAVEYLKGRGEGKTLTLMTCWPPGTTWKRLLVIGEIAQ